MEGLDEPGVRVSFIGDVRGVPEGVNLRFWRLGSWRLRGEVEGLSGGEEGWCCSMIMGEGEGEGEGGILRIKFSMSCRWRQAECDCGIGAGGSSVFVLG